MENSDEIVILRAYRPFLTFLSVFKLDNFRCIDRCILLRNVCRAIGCSVIIAVTVTFVLTDLFVSYKHNFELDKIIQQLSFVVIGITLPLIYAIMFWNTQRIVDILDDLHGIVVESKAYFFIPFLYSSAEIGNNGGSSASKFAILVLKSGENI